jgi:DNA-directed RNA polymerase subunit F
MSKPEIVGRVPVSLAELKAELTAIHKRDGEPSFRAGKTMDYINHFKPLSKVAASELSKKLVALDIPRLKEEHIVKLVDLLPVSVDDVKVILQGYALTVTKENMSKIVDVVKEYKK